jgi:hypothetical protein
VPVRQRDQAHGLLDVLEPVEVGERQTVDLPRRPTVLPHEMTA